MFFSDLGVANNSAFAACALIVMLGSRGVVLVTTDRCPLSDEKWRHLLEGFTARNSGVQIQSAEAARGGSNRALIAALISRGSALMLAFDYPSYR